MEWVFYDGRYWLDFRKSKEGIRCISCSILYHDKSKGRIDVLFSEGIADRGLKNTGGVLIQNARNYNNSGNICFRKRIYFMQRQYKNTFFFWGVMDVIAIATYLFYSLGNGRILLFRYRSFTFFT